MIVITMRRQQIHSCVNIDAAINQKNVNVSLNGTKIIFQKFVNLKVYYNIKIRAFGT